MDKHYYHRVLCIGIGMAFVFSPYIWKFTSCFQFQVNLTFNDFTAQNMSNVMCTKYFIKLPLLGQIITKFSLSMVFFFFFFLSLNSITIVPLHMKLGICTGFGRSYIETCPQIFTLTLLLYTRVPKLIGSTHTLVYNLSSSK